MKYFSLAALLMAGVAFISCSSDDAIAEPQQSENADPKTYTLTIVAAKGGDAAGVGGTRALDLVLGTPNRLNAYWAFDEEVAVVNTSRANDIEGSLKVKENDNNDLTKLSGTITGTIQENDVLMLKFKSASYDNQKGTLDYIEQNCDYAIAYVKVKTVGVGNIEVEGCYSDGTLTQSNTVTFENQQAIVMFTLKNADSGASIIASKLVVNGYTITPLGDPTDVLYVALPAAASINLEATDGADNKYTFTKSGTPFTNGQYYEITVYMTQTVEP